MGEVARLWSATRSGLKVLGPGFLFDFARGKTPWLKSPQRLLVRPCYRVMCRLGARQGLPHPRRRLGPQPFHI